MVRFYRMDFGGVGAHTRGIQCHFGGGATVDSSDEQADSTDCRDDTWSLLRGALKDVFAELGGGEAYLQVERGDFYRRESSPDER